MTGTRAFSLTSHIMYALTDGLGFQGYAYGRVCPYDAADAQVITVH